MNYRAGIYNGNAGYCEVKVTDSLLEITFPMTVVYPTDAQEQSIRLGPYPLEAAMNAEPREGKYPLVLLSHGSGSSPFVYRSLARHLARSGFIVGLPEHPYNNRNDNSLEGTVDNLTYRPRHLCLAADWFYKEERFKSLVNQDGFSVIGHSMGAYTALAAAGGVPTSFPNESPEGHSHSIEAAHDQRIRSLILLAPASVWFRKKDALRNVNVPILMLDAEHDPYTPPLHAQIILNGVTDPRMIRYRTIKNAGHYSFLSPFPPAMISQAFLPSQDPPGFDRVQFHEWLQSEIVSFLLTKHS